MCIITEIKYIKGGFSNGLDTAKHRLAMGNRSGNKSSAQRKTRVQMWIIAYKINGTYTKILIYMEFKLTEGGSNPWGKKSKSDDIIHENFAKLVEDTNPKG